MNEKDLVKCKVCGALIDKNTGETAVVEGSNAHKIQDLKKNYLKLQEDIKRIKEENDDLKDILKSVKGGTKSHEFKLESADPGEDLSELLGDL